MTQVAHTLDLGQRVELIPIDAYCDNVTFALYLRRDAGGTYYIVHTYNASASAQERAHQILRAMETLGGMEPVPGHPNSLRFRCGKDHLKACRRLFLEAGKLPSGSEPQPRPLEMEDKKTNQMIRAVYIGNGSYRISGDTEEFNKTRVPVYVNGLMKLGEIAYPEGQPDVVQFSCCTAHDPLIGLLLNRAQNVRAVMREEELQAARGVLSAPSAQQEG